MFPTFLNLYGFPTWPTMHISYLYVSITLTCVAHARMNARIIRNTNSEPFFSFLADKCDEAKVTHEGMGEAKYNNNKYRNQQIRIIGFPVRENEHNDGQESSDAAQSLSTYVVRLSPSRDPRHS